MHFTTSIEAVNPHTGELTQYNGPVIEANSWDEAQYACDRNCPYCRVDGELTGETVYLNKYELN